MDNNSKKPVIGVLTGDIQSTEHTRLLVRGFYDCAKHEDINIVLMPHDEPANYNKDLYIGKPDEKVFSLPLSVYDYVPAIKPDVLIIIYGNMTLWDRTEELETMLERYAGVPKLIFHDIAPKGMNTPYLVADNYNAMAECIRHLVVDHEYQKIGYVSGPKTHRDSMERLRAYMDVMAAHELPVEEGMVVFGDYTDSVGDLVEGLLNQFPDLEAIAFANDHMADAGYTVCKRRGLVIGKDIAITGYDDSSVARQLVPSMTSVTQNGSIDVYKAVQMALDIYNGKTVESCHSTGKLIVRGSCGCDKHLLRRPADETNASYVPSWLGDYISTSCDDMFRDVAYKAYRRDVYDSFIDLANLWCDEFFYKKQDCFDNNRMVPYLEKMLRSPYVSDAMLEEYLIPVISDISEYGATESIRAEILRTLYYVQNYINGSKEARSREALARNSQEAWFLCVFTRSIMAKTTKIDEAMMDIMKSLKSVNIPSVYFYLYKREEDTINLKKDELFLSAYYNEGEMVSLPEDQWISTSGGISHTLPDDKGNVYFSFPIVSGLAQYGLMISKVSQDQLHFMTEVASQVGSFIQTLLLYSVQLENNRRIEHHNEILTHMSKTDAMTGLLNRRGFFDDAFSFLQNNEGKRGVILSVDLDHLKEINDTFGHEEGDFAITTAASYLNSCLPIGSLISRIGGDEYMALFVLGDESIEQIYDKFKALAQKTNNHSGKPYYVEVSVGSCDFEIKLETKLADIIKKSDKSLYLHKTLRRDSIKKPA